LMNPTLKSSAHTLQPGYKPINPTNHHPFIFKFSNSQIFKFSTYEKVLQRSSPSYRQVNRQMC
jgi:hypothetical protein